MYKGIAKAIHREIVAQKEVDGVEMGVLDDGTPFLSSRGLARLCGVVPSAILGWLPTFDPKSDKPRDRKLLEYLAAHGNDGTQLLIPTVVDGRQVNAHPDSVCIAVLEYYAYDDGREQARQAYRRLAQRTLRDFIYTAVGYDPQQQLSVSWKNYYDRLMLNRIPQGFFSVFREMAELQVWAMQNGLPHDEHTVPDISVGQTWAHHWKDVAGDDLYGSRQKWPHTYPSTYPQSQAETDAWVYPLHALGEFRSWLQEVYLPQKYPVYIARKVRLGALTASTAQLLLAAASDLPAIEGSSDS